MNFVFGNLAFEEVKRFLIETDSEFLTPLSSKVNLDEYAKKLSDYSSFAYCIDEKEIIGMISCYTNQPPTGYISNVCIKSNFQGQGLFSKLFSLLVDNCKQLKITILKLEVDNNNVNAQQVYLRKGFNFIHQASEHSKYMEYQIS